MKTLIVGTSYVHGASAATVFGLWAKTVRALNPDTDVLVVDSKSPTALPDHGFRQHTFPENIGHRSLNGKDGWGRAFVYGLQWAMDQDYEWVVCMDCDLLFARPVAETVEKMARYGVRCAAPMAFPYQFTETALSFWNVGYLKEIDLIGKYDWQTPKTVLNPEQHIDNICKDAMFALPFRGMRNDGRITGQHLRMAFQNGIDWITHAELPILKLFLEMNGLE
jgi:glycosyltransferase involved in cell wall biosynthesis